MAALYYLCVLCALFEISAAAYCHTGWYEYRSCTYGCCDVSYSTYDTCCTSSTTVSSGVYVGGAIGGIIFICVVVGVVICLCAKSSRPGRVIHTTIANPGISTVSTTNYTNRQYQGYHTPAYLPQPYNAYPHHPNAAYSPPSPPPPKPISPIQPRYKVTMVRATAVVVKKA